MRDYEIRSGREGVGLFPAPSFFLLLSNGEFGGVQDMGKQMLEIFHMDGG